MVAVVWGVYVVYIIETYGATSTVVAVVWGAYPAYIVNGAYMVYIIETYGATSTVVAVVWGVYLAYIVNAYGPPRSWWQSSWYWCGRLLLVESQCSEGQSPLHALVLCRVRWRPSARLGAHRVDPDLSLSCHGP